MGEYVININWGKGGGGGRSSGSGDRLKSYGNGSRLLPLSYLINNDEETPLTPNTFYGMEEVRDGVNKFTITNQGELLKQRGIFFFRNRTIGDKIKTAIGDWKTFSDVPETEWREGKPVERGSEETIYYRTIAYSATQALRLLNIHLSSHYQYASAIASSTAELNAVNDYHNAMTGLGWVGSIGGGTIIGAKIGSVAGPVGGAIGAAIGATVAVANKVATSITENRILNYKQAINATTSAYQLGVLGDATYGRSRQSIG